MPGSLAPEEEINTWPEIALYLGISVREAQYREKNEGLPIRRVGGKTRVWALRSELDSWKLGTQAGEDSVQVSAAPAPVAINPNAGPVPEKVGDPSRRVSRRWAVSLISILAVAAIAVLWMVFRSRAYQGPVRAEVTGNTLSAMDERGRTLWQHPFPQPLLDRGTHRTDGHPGRTIQVADLYGKGTRQVLFAATFAKIDGPPETVDYEELYCFSSKGEILWRYKPKVAVTMGDTRFNGPWSIMDVLVVPGGPRPKIWLALAHWMLRPGVLLAVSSEGVPEVRFIDAGHIYAITAVTTASGRFILAGGINNEYAAAYVAVVRESASASCSPQTPGSPFACNDITNVNPERYFLFPPTDVSIADGLPYNAVQTIQTVGDDFVITVQEAAHIGAANSIYSLSPSLEVRDVFFDDGWAVAHHRFELTGILRHPLTDCPLITEPVHVKRWEKSSGWTTVAVPFRQGVTPSTSAVVSR